MSRKIIAVDFDGTLCQDNFPGIGSANTCVINKLKSEKLNGAQIILWTCRSGSYLEDAVNWCKDKGIIFDAINDNVPEIMDLFKENTRKIVATEYWDDKAINVKNII